jgi:ribosome-associated protein
MAKKPAAPKKKSPAKSPARARAAAAPSTAPDPSRQTALDLARWALDKKALDVVVMDVRGLASYAEYFVVMTAESDPQLGAIADYLEQKMKERGERPLGIEGQRSGRWVLIDFGDVVAHVFYQDTREFYDLEGLWADAPRQLVKDEPSAGRGLHA